ncbi:MAG TPA: hypothetical protein VGO08_03775, partial [Burkholderiales bacterium]|nr:hypothetical protein [Burkholderiales bacterium]
MGTVQHRCQLRVLPQRQPDDSLFDQRRASEGVDSRSRKHRTDFVVVEPERLEASGIRIVVKLE